jgi:hypothetical protein
MTNETKQSDSPKPYRFVSDEDPWFRFLRIYRRGVRKPIANICYCYSDDLAEQLSAVLAKTPDLLPSCNQHVAELIAELKFGDPEETRFHRRFDIRLIEGFKIAMIETVRRSA